MSQAAEIEAVSFKSLGDRYVFQAASPWLFGRGERYLVTKAQKRELLAILTPRRPVLRIAAITAAIVAWTAVVALAVWLFSGADQPGTREVAAIFISIVVPLFLAVVVALRRNRRRMHPILAGAPRTEERITRREQRTAMANAVTLRRAVMFGTLWSMICGLQVFALVMRNDRHPLFGDAQSYIKLFAATLAAGLVAYYLVLIVRKLRQKSAGAA